MRKQHCIICGKMRLTEELNKKWVCKDCLIKANEIMDNSAERPKKACPKCRVLKLGECPFTDAERKKIIFCNRFIHKEAERNKKRWEKYDF